MTTTIYYYTIPTPMPDDAAASLVAKGAPWFAVSTPVPTGLDKPVIPPATPYASGWSNLTLTANCVSRAAMPTVGVRSEGFGSRAVMQGGLDITGAYANGDVLATVPAGPLRPTYTVTLPGRWSGGTAILTIDSAGVIKLANALASPNWVSFDNANWKLG